jgi:hypothetical protein
VYKIEQHGRTSLRRPKLSKEVVKRLMKKKKKRNTALYLVLNCPDHPGSGLPKDHSTYIYDEVPQTHLALYSTS